MTEKEDVLLLKYDDVSFTYRGGDKPSVQNIDLSIVEGRCVLLCGKSGCGKTSLLRICNGLVPNFYDGHVTGDILYRDKSLLGMSISDIVGIAGTVFQDPKTQFFTTDTTSEVAFGVENLAVAAKELGRIVGNAFRTMKIERLRDRSLFALSGGEKQKVAIASIYAMNPAVYLFDEPSSNLDHDAIDELARIIGLLKSKGKTVIVAEHRLYYLKDIVDEIYYLDDGLVTRHFSVEEFLSMRTEVRQSLGLRTMTLAEESPRVQLTTKGKECLCLEEVTVFYGKRQVLEGIDLRAEKGECIGIVGKNGVGKSLFVRTLTGLHGDSRGTFMVNGRAAGRKERLKQAYLVMQDVGYQLFADSVEEECRFGLRGVSDEEVANVLRRLRLYKHREKHPNILSGGQKQRLAVAVSDISKKNVLVFDEPTSGQDYESMLLVSGLIEGLRKKGKLIFVVTHDYEFICKTCTRIVHIDDGTVKDDFILDENVAGQRKLQAIFNIPFEKRFD
ncbi:ABC transporter ATP-binding protein [Prosthecochloris sp. SCSIO W1101]|uniref:ABC transporter ATP-binding protein n=1 Tax=Prosthecochloris sp. SCSIO W1101 TaxID=2992242 RepID=UPI00223E01F2|nr:ABC transporter ATP-binding protein [Prosthecochloris sp. SCSIO W1101]UZJ40538.1 ABC transporter ATP-binding protein [Prosthecochloris sp. SCSIO W1101]